MYTEFLWRFSIFEQNVLIIWGLVYKQISNISVYDCAQFHWLSRLPFIFTCGQFTMKITKRDQGEFDITEATLIMAKVKYKV